MKMLIYLVLAAVVFYCGFLLYQKIFEQESAPTPATASSETAPVVSQSTSSGPISQTKMMQRVKNINDQHNTSISK
jgi:hypothetical protein